MVPAAKAIPALITFIEATGSLEVKFLNLGKTNKRENLPKKILLIKAKVRRSKTFKTISANI